MKHLKKEDIEKLDAICEKYSMHPTFSRGKQSLKDFYHTMFLLTHIGVQISAEDFGYVESLLGLKDIKEMRVLFLNIEDLKKYISFEQASITNSLWVCGKTEIVIDSKPYYFDYLTDNGKSYRFEGDIETPFNDLELSEANCKIMFTIENRKGWTGENVDGWALSKIVVKQTINKEGD